jgi:hypothetical protein
MSISKNRKIHNIYFTAKFSKIKSPNWRHANQGWKRRRLVTAFVDFKAELREILELPRR